jgi:mono/diheme cytochrome c family protein
MKKNKFLVILCLVFYSLLNSCADEKQAQSRANANHGLELYERMCANCHQSDGSGFVKLYPPLKNADYLKQNPKAIFGIIKNGLRGSILVNGTEFNLVMPANPKLSDKEIEHIVEYVQTRFLSSSE